MRNMSIFKLFAAVLFILVFVSPVSLFADTVTVGVGLGYDYATIQEGINAAANGDTVMVAAGTYTGAGNYNLDLLGKAITVKSENGPENCIIDCEDILGRRGFYLHSGEGVDSIISGFTIQNGYVNTKGAGIYCANASPVIENCIIKSNKAIGDDGEEDYDEVDGDSVYGGGIAFVNSNAKVSNCVITDNEVRGGNGVSWWDDHEFPYEDYGIGGHAYGGGIYADGDSEIVIEKCQISSNDAVGGDSFDGNNLPNGSAFGGGVYGKVTIRDSVVSFNNTTTDFGSMGTVVSRGGGIYANSESEIHNCLVASNTAIGESNNNTPDEFVVAGIYGGQITVENCTVCSNVSISNNSNVEGVGGIYCSAASVVTDCIIWDNGNDIDTCSATYSCIEDMDAGVGNIHSDPCFVGGSLDGYYLSSIAAGQGADSLCVDAGSDIAAALGMDGYTMRTDDYPDTGVVDMGYHRVPLSSVGDLNGDGIVNFKDVAILGYQWQGLPGSPSADISPEPNDNFVDEEDLELLLSQWLWEYPGNLLMYGTSSSLSGSGTSNDPYLIKSLADLNLFADPCSSSTYWAIDVHTKLDCDIDLGGRVYDNSVIAPTTLEAYYTTGLVPYRGVFDGGGHVISNLTIETAVDSNGFCIGFFGVIDDPNAEVKNLGIDNINIIDVNSYGLIGGLVGCSGEWDNPEGGVIISNCYATGSITGGDNFSTVGGLCGWNGEGSVISDCYSNVSITCGDDSSNIGGLLGINYRGGVSNCYSLGAIVTGGSPSDVGGFCGKDTDGTISSSYWDVDTSGVGISGDDNFGATGKTTSEMKAESTFTGWDFVSLWSIDEGVSYPQLR